MAPERLLYRDVVDVVTKRLLHLPAALVDEKVDDVGRERERYDEQAEVLHVGERHHQQEDEGEEASELGVGQRQQ